MLEGFDTPTQVDVSELPITVQLQAGVPKVRKWVRVEGLSSGAKVGVHNNSLPNVLRALAERVYLVKKDGVLQRPPQALEGVFKSRLGAFASGLGRHLGKLTPYTQEEFLSTYSGAKRKVYERAFESLQASPFSRIDGRLKSFVKAEKLQLYAKPDPAPRIIQPRDVRYNAVLGPFVKRLEHRLYKAIGRMFPDRGVTVMKGLNAVDSATVLRAKWDMFAKPVGVGMDASRFDQHVGQQALRYEHGVYKRAYPGYEAELGPVLAMQLENRGVVLLPEARVTYVVQGNRMSGDMNTSCGNCLLMCAMVHAYAAERGVRVCLANNGDDCMVIMESEDLERFSAGLEQWFVDMGFTMLLEPPRYVFEQLEFCQTKPVYNGTEWVMCRSPVAGLNKDTMCLKPDWTRLVASMHAWMHDVGTCGLAVSIGVPIMCRLYDILAGCKEGKVLDVMNVHGGLGAASLGLSDRVTRRAVDAPISPMARVSFYEAWGIMPETQIAVEELLAGRPVPTTVTHESCDWDSKGIRTLFELAADGEI